MAADHQHMGAAEQVAAHVNAAFVLLRHCVIEKQGQIQGNIPLYKAEEAVKETYMDAELKVLLKKPNTRKCVFSEYRNWVIVNRKETPELMT